MRDEERLSTKSRPKHLADSATVIDIVRFLWERDELEFANSRMRVQLAFGIVFMLFTGVRPGELCESSAHRKSNEGLHWGDVTLMVLCDRGREPLFFAQFRIRNRKNKRGQEHKV